MRADDRRALAVRALEQRDLGPGGAGDDAAGGVVPGGEVELVVGVDGAGGEGAEVERRRAAAAQVGDLPEELGGDGALQLALAAAVREPRRDDRRAQRLGAAPEREPPPAASAWPVATRRAAPVEALAARLAALDACVQPPEARVADDAEQRLTVDLDRDRAAEEGEAEGEVGGAVEGVDDPAHAARALAQGALLGQQRHRPAARARAPRRCAPRPRGRRR